ncbi:hypothetical protein B0H14DRAFT_2566210 [Mycena olivaceomarginata]|nr:hypothetical protein B0H14DRAFT_2566210 [Mycena olivaceomarginata]
MANTGTLAAARQRKSQRLAEDKAKGITMSTKRSSPPSTVLSLSDSEQPLHFPDSPTTMATPSDDDLPSSIPLPPTGSKHKSGSGVLSDDESDFAPEPAKKKRGRRLMAQSDSEVEEVVQKPPKKKPGPKPKPKAVAKAKPAVKCSTPFVPKLTPIDFFRKESTRLRHGERRNGGNGQPAPLCTPMS